MRLTERFEARQEVDGWSVVDMRDGVPMTVGDIALVRLSEGVAAKWVDQLNRLGRDRLQS